MPALIYPYPSQSTKKNGNQQIDYYQGLQSDFYLGKDTYKYAYQNSVRKCIKNEAPHVSDSDNVGEGGMVHPLPMDLKDYTYVGKKVVGGKIILRFGKKVVGGKFWIWSLSGTVVVGRCKCYWLICVSPGGIFI